MTDGKRVHHCIDQSHTNECRRPISRSHQDCRPFLRVISCFVFYIAHHSFLRCNFPRLIVVISYDRSCRCITGKSGRVHADAGLLGPRVDIRVPRTSGPPIQDLRRRVLGDASRQDRQRNETDGQSTRRQCPPSTIHRCVGLFSMLGGGISHFTWPHTVSNLTWNALFPLFNFIALKLLANRYECKLYVESMVKLTLRSLQHCRGSRFYFARNCALDFRTRESSNAFFAAIP